jgi:hypothetical protein
MTSRSLPATLSSQAPLSETCFRDEETAGLLSVPRAGIAPSTADAPSVPRKPRRLIIEGYRDCTKRGYKPRASKRFNLPEGWDPHSYPKLSGRKAGKSEFIPFYDDEMRKFWVFERMGGLRRPSSRAVRSGTSELPAWFWEHWRSNRTVQTSGSFRPPRWCLGNRRFPG